MSNETTTTATTATPQPQATATVDSATSNSTNTTDNTNTEKVVEEMIKLKVLGEEKEYPRSEVLKLAQLGLGANKKFEEVAKTRKELESFTKRMVENPLEFLRNHPNREAILQASQELLSEYVEEQEKLNSMSDSEKRAVELQKELDRRQKELDERDQRIQQQLQEHYRTQFQKEIFAALEKTDLPVNEGSVIRVANLYKQALASGIQTTFEQCAKIIEKDYLGYLDEISKKRAKLEKQKNPRPRIVSTDSKEKKKKTMEEFNKELQQRYNL